MSASSVSSITRTHKTHAQEEEEEDKRRAPNRFIYELLLRVSTLFTSTVGHR
jgi:hypothetical protein